MRIIHVKDRGFIKVDSDDFEMLAKYRWHITANGYASVSRKSGRVWMHRLIMNTPKGLFVDHINGDKLDNRKCNLRNATRSQNGMNKPKMANNKSGYKGVTFNKRLQKWVAQIKLEDKKMHIGTFFCKIEAAKAFDMKAIALHGEYAKLNFDRSLY